MWTLLKWVGPDHLTQVEWQRGLQCVRKAEPQFNCMAVDVLQGCYSLQLDIHSGLFPRATLHIYPVHGINT